MSTKSKQRALVESLDQVPNEKQENGKLSDGGKRVIAMVEFAIFVTGIVDFILCKQFRINPPWSSLFGILLALYISYLVCRIMPKKNFIRLGKWSLWIYLAIMAIAIVFCIIAYCCGIEPYAGRIEWLMSHM